jgi:hypothetical protein
LNPIVVQTVKKFDQKRKRYISEIQETESLMEKKKIALARQIYLIQNVVPAASEKAEEKPSSTVLNFFIDVARHLGFYREPSSGSWEFAGASYSMKRFAMIVSMKLEGKDIDLKDLDSTANQIITEEVNEVTSLGKAKKVYKSVLLKTWYEMYCNAPENLKTWNLSIMCDKGMIDAMNEYNGLLLSAEWIKEDLPILSGDILAAWRDRHRKVCLKGLKRKPS